MSKEKLLINNTKSNNSEVMRNKQIGEIGKILTEYEDCGDCNNCPYHECCGEERLATELYNAGYRKQSEVIHCKDCGVPHNKWTGCPKLNGLVTNPDFYCACAEPKMKGGAE